MNSLNSENVIVTISRAFFVLDLRSRRIALSSALLAVPVPSRRLAIWAALSAASAMHREVPTPAAEYTSVEKFVGRHAHGSAVS